ncbi:MAG: hypothetical protein Q4C49_05545 [Bacillota bacterium]|nr:hypothetical protein [Bacillota bacterium]
MAGSVNGIKITKITKKMIEKGFDTKIQLKEILPKLKYTLAHEGSAYGLFQNKSLVGIYILRMEENYFQNNGISLKKRASTSTDSVLRLVYYKTLPEMKSFLSKIEKKILVELKGKMYEGVICGIEWKNRLIYTQKVYGKLKMYLISFFLGLLIGLLVGKILFKDWLIALYISLGCSIVGLLIGATILQERSVGKVKLTRHG